MRLGAQHIEQLKRLAVEEAGPHARLRLFGSRLDDAATGGDVDLLLELTAPVAEPAVLVARMAARASRVLGGRKVDVVLAAPNLKCLPIHEAALRRGVVL
ncbi:MAG: nucleotidyltransferase domain-containing protein [Rhodanobacter sp.]|nr:MAG: nucleotidyltransferase domain-containing protein [Rhodanobacter sp.]